MTRTYTELAKLPTFEERFAYLATNSNVGEETFGHERQFNQAFYRSYEWKQIRNSVIARDLGCDLGIEGLGISYRVIIHHMNPITPREIQDRSSDILDPEYLITTSLNTHNAIHYGDINSAYNRIVERTPGDTKLW